MEAPTGTRGKPLGSSSCVLDVLADRLIQFWYGRGPTEPSVSVVDGQQARPLAEAAFHGDECGVFVVLHHFATNFSPQERRKFVNHKGTRGWSALHEAVAYPNICRLLIEKGGANVDLRDDNGYTALHFAIEQASDEVACLLIDNGAQVDCTDYRTERTPLILAAVYGRHIVARRLLAAGAMVDRPSPHIHRTPLHVAAAAGHDRVVKVLLEGGADVDAKDSYHGSTPLHLCVGRNDIESGDEEESYLASANLLICFGGANLHAQTDEGLETPLDVATKAENESLVRLLLQHGADPNI